VAVSCVNQFSRYHWRQGRSKSCLTWNRAEARLDHTRTVCLPAIDFWGPVIRWCSTAVFLMTVWAKEDLWRRYAETFRCGWSFQAEFVHSGPAMWIRGSTFDVRQYTGRQGRAVDCYQACSWIYLNVIEVYVLELSPYMGTVLYTWVAAGEGWSTTLGVETDAAGRFSYSLNSLLVSVKSLWSIAWS